MKNKILSFLLLPFLGFLGAAEHPFQYDLHLFSIPGNNRTIVCFHGYGDSYHIAETLKNLYRPESTLVSFNFPDYDILQGKKNPLTVTFGTINELLPALYVLKKTVIDQKLESVDLYGFSAGGAAVINTIAVLNTPTYDAELKRIGIGPDEKKKLLSAIQNGIVILDAPLKSIEEIIASRGNIEDLEMLAKNYRNNNLRPIDSLRFLKGLNLKILLYFDKHDEALSNRDDQLFIDRLIYAQSKENVIAIIEDSGGHTAPHYRLWQIYSQKTKGPKQ